MTTVQPWQDEPPILETIKLQPTPAALAAADSIVWKGLEGGFYSKEWRQATRYAIALAMDFYALQLGEEIVALKETINTMGASVAQVLGLLNEAETYNIPTPGVMPGTFYVARMKAIEEQEYTLAVGMLNEMIAADPREGTDEEPQP